MKNKSLAIFISSVIVGVSVSIQAAPGRAIQISPPGDRYEIDRGRWGHAFSDRNLKENIESINPEVVLDKVVKLPVSTWNYKQDENGMRHIGPMAQDFQAAFGVGDGKHIYLVDTNGVALAAIQGLHKKLQEKDAKITLQKARVSDLEMRIAALENNPANGSLPWRTYGGILLLLVVATLSGRLLKGRR